MRHTVMASLALLRSGMLNLLLSKDVEHKGVTQRRCHEVQMLTAQIKLNNSNSF